MNGSIRCFHIKITCIDASVEIIWVSLSIYEYTGILVIFYAEGAAVTNIARKKNKIPTFFMLRYDL